MAKTRRGPELYEMLSPDRKETARLLEPPSRVPTPDSAKIETPRRVPDPVERTEAALRSQAKPEHAGVALRPLVSIDGACLTVSLTSKRAAIVFFVLLVGAALGARAISGYGGSRYAAGHEVGRASYVAGAIDEISAARAAPPQSEIVASLLADANQGLSANLPQPGVNSVGPTAWIRGHSYVVVQEFGVGLTVDAERARDFLLQNGIEAEIVPMPAGRMQLITAQGYNLRDPAQKKMAQALLDRVRRCGETYFAEQGGYRLDGYLKTLKTENW
jgi:hypothetical protein